MATMLVVQACGDQDIDRLADKLIVCVTKHAFDLAVGEHDLSKRLNYDDAERADLDCGPVYRFLFHFRARVACGLRGKVVHAHIPLRVVAVRRLAPWAAAV
jgi:hypothetical protein